MARIAFFTEALPPHSDAISRFAWSLIRSLADQNHDISVFSTFQEDVGSPDSHPRVQTFRPFRHWNLLELPRVAPLLLQLQPEVLHVIQPHLAALDGLTNAMSFLPGLAPLLGRPPVVASFFDIDERTLIRHRTILGAADLLTVSNQRQADFMKAFFTKRSPPQIEVVPLGFDLGASSGGEQSPLAEEIIIDDLENQIQDLQGQYSELICVPGPVDLHTSALDLFTILTECLVRRPQSAVVLIGGWGHVPVRERRRAEEILYHAGVENRVLLTGPVRAEDMRRVIRASRCVFAATVTETRLGFTEVIRLSQSASAALVLSVEQARLDPIGWRDGENALIRHRDVSDLSEAVAAILDDNGLRERLSRNVTELSRAAVGDSPGNIVSRLYSRLLVNR